MTKKLDANDCSLSHLTSVLLLHYLVKCRSRSFTELFKNRSCPVILETRCTQLSVLKARTERP